MMAVVAPVNYSQACRSSAIPPNPQSECLFSELTTSSILPCPSFLFFSPLPFYFFLLLLRFQAGMHIWYLFWLPWKEYFFTLVADLWYPNSVAASTITHQPNLSHLPPFPQGPGFFSLLFFSFFFCVHAREREGVWTSEPVSDKVRY